MLINYKNDKNVYDKEKNTKIHKARVVHFRHKAQTSAKSECCDIKRWQLAVHSPFPSLQCCYYKMNTNNHDATKKVKVKTRISGNFVKQDKFSNSLKTTVMKTLGKQSVRFSMTMAHEIHKKIGQINR